MQAATQNTYRPGLPASGPTSPIRGAIADDVLITAARGGDLYAWEELVRRHQGLIFRCAFLTTRDSHLAEEATALAFVRAFRSLSSLETEAAFRPWLMRITAGVSRTRVRESAQQRDAKYVDPVYAQRLPADPLTPLGVYPAPTPLEREAMTAAFERLGNDDRMIVASRYALGLSRDEMAAYLGISEEDVDDRLRSALGRLRTYLGGV